jgi:4-amino-4-deoxy-L-arabinose transferase-like glycosyltransferase
MLRRGGWGFLAGPLCALALWLALALPSLERSTMQEMDELIYGSAAQGAALEGHWWPLHLEGRVFYEKPPLLLWLAGATAKLSGRPYAAWPYRVWTCLGAGLAVALLVLIGALLDRPGLGWTAAAALALQGDFVFHARFFTMDTPFVAAMMAALALALRALRSGRARDWVLAGVGLALCAAFKSWFVFTLAPAYVCAVALHVPRPGRKAAWLGLGLPVAAFLALWVLLYLDWMGLAFLREEWTENIVSRVTGGAHALDPDGHAAFYVGWASRTAPALLPWALAVPLALAPSGAAGAVSAGAEAGGGRALAFLRTWTCVFCVTWLLGMAWVRAETINYTLPLEAALCLGAGLMADAAGPSSKALLLACLLAASLLAALRLWDPFLCLCLGAPLGLAWMLSDRLRDSRARASTGGRALTKRSLALAALCSLLALGTGLAQSREALALLYRPVDTTRAMAGLLLDHPARSKGETLWLIGGASRVPNFYSSYTVRLLDALPARRPPEASLVKTKMGWVFFPAGLAAPGAQQRP